MAIERLKGVAALAWPRTRWRTGAFCVLLLSVSALAAQPLDVELLDAGTVTQRDLVCMSPAAAQTLDVGLRSAENERDGLRSAVLWTTAGMLVATIAAVAAGAAWALKK